MAAQVAKKAAETVTQKASSVSRKMQAVPIVYNTPKFIGKELVMAMGVSIFAGSFWKIYQWNEKRRNEDFLEMLEKGEITVVIEKGSSSS